MIIQHNVMELNAHRQLDGNDSLVAKKLSLAYRINRSGKEVTVFSVSDKMRTQITSIDYVKAIVQKGFSLIQIVKGVLCAIETKYHKIIFI